MAVKKKSAAKPKITTPNNTAFGLTDIGFQNAAKNAIPTETKPVITTPDNTAFGLTETEKRIYGFYTTQSGVEIPTGGADKDKAPDDKTKTTGQTNQIYILINKLKSVGIPEGLANRAGAFFTALQDDGIDDEDNMIDIFLNAKSYKAKKTGQEIASPYYQDFGKFNDGLSSAKPAGVLVPLVLGLRDTVRKYDTNGSLSLYATDESIQKYLKNDVKVSDLDGNLNQARLRGITADPVYTNTLIQMGFIKTAADLTGFFASPELGQKQLELNRNSAAIGAEALRRAKEGGVQLDTDFAKKEAARLTAQGYNEAQVSAIAEKGYQFINRNIMPTVKVSGIYQGAQAATAGTIQSELQQQEFMGVDSQRYETLAEQEARSFQGSAGNIRSPRISSYRDDITGLI